MVKFKTVFMYCYLVIECAAYFGGDNDDDCFCQLQGKIDDCTCEVETVDNFNNVKLYPRLRSLLTKDFFKFYKVNLMRPCPFWTDDSRCAIRYCHVEACSEDTIPEGLKEERRTCEEDKLGIIDTTISNKAKEDFVLWNAYDDAQDNYCVYDGQDEGAKYVDLSINPERYTGYRGKSARRIWKTIYQENCFKADDQVSGFYNPLKNLCLEERVFYRSISGLHSSINIHLCAKYLISEISLTSPKGEWGHNYQEFQKRFSPETTNGEGPDWLKNLYFVFLLELRALTKAAPYLLREGFYTGDDSQDWDTRMAIENLLNVVKSFPKHFNESSMFVESLQAENLKHEFKQHFRNISRIMDCVGCDKCKLWGKLQIHGLGTALKILFSGKFDHLPDQLFLLNKKDFQLTRNEIVALINSIGRLSTSIYELDEFRHLIKLNF